MTARVLRRTLTGVVLIAALAGGGITAMGAFAAPSATPAQGPFPNPFPTSGPSQPGQPSQPGWPSPTSQPSQPSQPGWPSQPGRPTPTAPSGPSQPSQPGQPGAGGVVDVEVSKANWEQLLEMSKTRPFVLDFGSEGCSGCELLTPVLKREVRKANGKWILGYLDTSKDFTIKKPFKIDALPTTVVIKNGKEVSRMRGWVSESNTLQFLKSSVGEYYILKD